jgi:hypothetical protein
MIHSSAARWRLLALFAAVLCALGLLTLASGQTPAKSAAGIHTARAASGHVSAGRMVKAQVSSKPFPVKHRTTSTARAPIGPRPLASSLKGPQGPATSVPAQAPGTLTFFKKTTPPAVCATSCAQSAINEPDTIGAGKVLFQTSNWNIAYTTNGGAASPLWQYQNPYSLNPNFCCDQTVTYVPSRNMIVRESLDLGSGSAQGFDIAIASPGAPTSWCTYHFNAANFGSTAGNLLDYPKIGYGDNNLYVTWNQYTPSGSAWINTGLARFPLDSLKACAGFGFNFLTRADNFTFGLSMGDSSSDTFYWASNWYTQSAGSGTSERLFHWAENSNTYFFSDVAVAAYNFSGGSCASQDGAVTNWCSRLDPRWETVSIGKSDWAANSNGAYGGDDLLTVAITAGPSGSDPFPYVIYEYFHAHGLGYIGTSATFNNGFAFAYGGCSPNPEGHLGCAATYGGGTGTTHFFPAGITILQDDFAPAQPWSFSFNQTGSGNATGWGDYEVTQPYNPSNGNWITTEWYINGSGTVRPQVLIFGRGRNAGGYGKWKNA